MRAIADGMVRPMPSDGAFPLGISRSDNLRITLATLLEAVPRIFTLDDEAMWSIDCKEVYDVLNDPRTLGERNITRGIHDALNTPCTPAGVNSLADVLQLLGLGRFQAATMTDRYLEL